MSRIDPVMALIQRWKIRFWKFDSIIKAVSLFDVQLFPNDLLETAGTVVHTFGAIYKVLTEPHCILTICLRWEYNIIGSVETKINRTKIIETKSEIG